MTKKTENSRMIHDTQTVERSIKNNAISLSGVPIYYVINFCTTRVSV